MALADVQRALALLYTDRAARERFWADPEAAGVEWGLTSDDIAQLAALSRPEVDQYAHGLMAKRRGEVAKLLPRTRAALGLQFRAFFTEYAAGFTPSGPGKHREDAVRFAAWLDDRNAGLGRHTVDMAAYEAACLTAFASGCRFQLRVYRTDVNADFASGEGRGPGRLTVVVWFRPPRGRLRHILVQWPRRARSLSRVIGESQHSVTG
jgi:hypothetical protein